MPEDIIRKLEGDPEYQRIFEIKSQYGDVIDSLMSLTITDQAKAAILLALTGDKKGSGFGEIMFEEVYDIDSVPEGMLDDSYEPPHIPVSVEDLISGDLNSEACRKNNGAHEKLARIFDALALGYEIPRVHYNAGEHIIFHYNITVAQTPERLQVARELYNPGLFDCFEYYKAAFDSLEPDDKRNLVDVLAIYLDRAGRHYSSQELADLLKITIEAYESADNQNLYLWHYTTGWLFGYPVQDIGDAMAVDFDAIKNEKLIFKAVLDNPSLETVGLLNWDFSLENVKERAQLGIRFYNVLSILAGSDLPDRIIQSYYDYFS